MGNTQKQSPTYFETFYKQNTYKMCILCNSIYKEFNNDFYILVYYAAPITEQHYKIKHHAIDLRCSKGHLIRCNVSCSNSDESYLTLQQHLEDIKKNGSYYKNSVPSAPPIVEAKAILDDK